MIKEYLVGSVIFVVLVIKRWSRTHHVHRIVVVIVLKIVKSSPPPSIVLTSAPAISSKESSMQPPVDRRSFFRTLGLGAAGAMALRGDLAADAAAGFVQSNVKRASEPSALKITDLRYAVIVGAPMTCPVIRVDTNQGLVGWGEVRDGSSETYALMLKSRILGENPCNVDKIFRKIKQFGGPARQAGGVCGIEMSIARRPWPYQVVNTRFLKTVGL